MDKETKCLCAYSGLDTEVDDCHQLTAGFSPVDMKSETTPLGVLWAYWSKQRFVNMSSKQRLQKVALHLSVYSVDPESLGLNNSPTPEQKGKSS